MINNSSNRLQLHPEGPEFSKISAGFWRLNEWGFSTSDLIEFIELALENGITTFDHADIYGAYGNEAIFGKALKEKPSLREKMELVTKCGICLTTKNRPDHTIQHYNTTAGHIRSSVERSLKNLSADVIDLVLIHRPDPLMDASEMAGAFQKLIDEGKIKHVGVSNFTPSQFELFQGKLDEPLVTNQVECSLLHLNPIYDGTFDQAQQYNTSPMIWSPFAGGQIFTGNDDRTKRVRAACSVLAEKYEATPDQIALMWLLRLPSNPLPVIGTGKKDRLVRAAKAAEIRLERQDWFRLLKASQGHPVP
jgi:predicted oxidoreductase